MSLGYETSSSKFEALSWRSYLWDLHNKRARDIIIECCATFDLVHSIFRMDAGPDIGQEYIVIVLAVSCIDPNGV